MSVFRSAPISALCRWSAGLISVCASTNAARGNPARGSGACAAVAVGIQQGLLAETVRVELPGGRLDIAWKGPGQPLFMTGPAAHVYDGFIHL